MLYSVSPNSSANILDIGYRVWMVENSGLFGITIREPWNPGVNESICRARATTPIRASVSYSRTTAKLPRHSEVPGSGCACGFWSLDSLETAIHNVTNMNMAVARNQNHQRYVAGAIQYWGRTIRHTSGVRSRYARILGLLNPGYVVEEQVLIAVARAYDVPSFGAFESLEAYV